MNETLVRRYSYVRSQIGSVISAYNKGGQAPRRRNQFHCKMLASRKRSRLCCFKIYWERTFSNLKRFSLLYFIRTFCMKNLGVGWLQSHNLLCFPVGFAWRLYDLNSTFYWCTNFENKMPKLQKLCRLAMKSKPTNYERQISQNLKIILPDLFYSVCSLIWINITVLPKIVKDLTETQDWKVSSVQELRKSRVDP